MATNKMRKEKVVIMLALVLVLGLLVAGCASTTAQVTGSVNLAPDFQLPILGGKTVYLSDFRDKPVMLNFWASWCRPCRAEMPYIQQVYEEWSDKGLVVLAVNIGESSAKVKEFVLNYGLSFPVLLDTKGDIAQQYNIRAIPTTFFIDKSGAIKDIKIGAFPNKAAIEAGLDKIIP